MTGNATREALEPFANIARDWTDENGWTDLACQGDRICDWFGPSAFRRARTAYDAIGVGVKTLRSEIAEIFASVRRQHPVPLGLEDAVHQAVRRLSPVAVEEADAEAEERSELIKRLRQGVQVTGLHEDNTTELYDIEDADEVMSEAAQALTCASATARTATNDQIAAVLLRTGNPTDAQKEQLADYLGRSTPSPQIGNAGAGPMGEAVAWEDFVALRIKALEEGARSAKKDFAIEELAFVLKFAPRHAARPVEEPGEVERLKRERDDAVARYASAVKDAAEQRALAERRRVTIFQYMNDEKLLAAEAALAETRERLEKVEAELRYAAMGLDHIHNSLMTNGPKQASGEMTAHFLEHARAALTGDAQEGGK